MGEAVDFILETGVESMGLWEAELIITATEKLKAIGGITIVGEAEEKSGVISFLMDGAHPYDVGVILDQLGIAIRTGHHCTQPLMDRFGIREPVVHHLRCTTIMRILTASLPEWNGQRKCW